MPPELDREFAAPRDANGDCCNGKPQQPGPQECCVETPSAVGQPGNGLEPGTIRLNGETYYNASHLLHAAREGAWKERQQQCKWLLDQANAETARHLDLANIHTGQAQAFREMADAVKASM